MSDAPTTITFLLDRTGSMSTIKDATIEAFNAYLKTLQAEAPEALFSLLQFDSQSLDKVCVNAPVADVAALNDKTFQPRAATPLIDAAYKTIKAVETALAARGGETKVVICIQTDGEENASTEHTWADLNALIKEKTALGWQFNFMGAGIDAYKQASRMGIERMSAMSYEKHNLGATIAGFRAQAANTARFASGAALNTGYSRAQKEAAGDAFDVLAPTAPLTPHVAVDDFSL